MPKFGDTERYIKTLFKINETFCYRGVCYIVLNSGKPTPTKGECKTDIYVLAKSPKGDFKEFKISIKQDNADFLENKICLDRAVEILGKEAQSIIETCTTSIKKTFEDDYLIYFQSRGKTEAMSIKMGWKFEFVNKLGGEKCGQIPLIDQQKIDVYAGTNLSESKRNCNVNGKIIKDSGIANYIMTIDHTGENLNYYLSKMQPIEEFAKRQNIYFVCKALNYRTSKTKWDGDRPLAVYVNWILKDNKLCGELVFTNPLSVKGNQIGRNIANILLQLNINSTNFENLKGALSKTVRHM